MLHRDRRHSPAQHGTRNPRLPKDLTQSPTSVPVESFPPTSPKQSTEANVLLACLLQPQDGLVIHTNRNRVGLGLGLAIWIRKCISACFWRKCISSAKCWLLINTNVNVYLLWVQRNSTHQTSHPMLQLMSHFQYTSHSCELRHLFLANYVKTRHHPKPGST